MALGFILYCVVWISFIYLIVPHVLKLFGFAFFPTSSYFAFFTLGSLSGSVCLLGIIRKACFFFAVEKTPFFLLACVHS